MRGFPCSTRFFDFIFEKYGMEIFRYHKIWYAAKGSFSVKNPAVNGGVFD